MRVEVDDGVRLKLEWLVLLRVTGHRPPIGEKLGMCRRYFSLSGVSENVYVIVSKPVDNTNAPICLETAEYHQR